VRAQCAGRAQTGVSVWSAQGSPAAGGAVTATLSATASAAVIEVVRYSGASASSPLGAVVSGNTLGVNGACSGGVDSAAYSFPLSTTASNAEVFAAAGMRNRTHTPGAGYNERAEVMAGSSGSAAAEAVMDQSVPSPASVPVNGTFSGAIDWAVVAVEIR
jgi:hypothetical protein